MPSGVWPATSAWSTAGQIDHTRAVRAITWVIGLVEAAVRKGDRADMMPRPRACDLVPIRSGHPPVTTRSTVSDDQFDSIDFFRTKELIDNPYPYLEHLRGSARWSRSPTTTSTW